MKKLGVITLLFAFSVGAQSWQQDIKQWRSERVSNLTKEHGWLSLIGMEWLHKGDNTIGSATDNNIVLPHGATHLGTFNMSGEGITFSAKKGVVIHANNEQVDGVIDVVMDSSGSPTVFTVDSFNFYVIERGKPALRIKDSQADTRINFKGIDYFPLSDKFRVQAKFIPYNPVKIIEIINVLGLLSKEKALGVLSFEIDNKNYQLDAMADDDDLYIIFADKTSGRSSYGPGRFLYVEKPKNGDITTIDFNQAYNPPCAFTEYSTCSLPPPQNRMGVYIKAGEKKYKH